MNVLLMCLLAAEPMFAPRMTTDVLAIVPIVVSGPAATSNAKSVHEAVLAATEGRIGIRVVSREEMFVADAGQFGERLTDCGNDASCLASRLRAFDARLGLLAVVNSVVDPPLISLRLLDTEARSLLAEDLAPLSPAEKNIATALRRRASKLFEETGYPMADRVAVKVGPSDATWELYGDQPLVRKDGVLLLKPGSYRIMASSPGHLPLDKNLNVTGGSEQSVTLQLEEETNLATSPWLWAGIGVAVAAATVAIIVVAQPGDPCLCISEPGIKCGDCPVAP